MTDRKRKNYTTCFHTKEMSEVFKVTEIQKKLWYILCECSGEDVARLFTNYYGNGLLDEEFYEFLKDEGYVWDEE